MGTLNRRQLVAASIASGLAAAARPVDAGTSSPAAPAGDRPFALAEATIADLQDGMKTGKWSARTITEAYLARIDAMDAAGPALRSVLERNADALAIAESLDRERKEGRVRGPLHGIPVLVKDNIDTADRMATTAGSLALAGARPARDAEVVHRLRSAGAVLLGKTNLSEWANIRSSTSTSGWSGRGGLTRNPYALDRNPCGSSSGSGAAVSANLCAAAVGTETDGSIVSPSSANGIVGVKPTVGLASRSGIIPISHSQDTPGPMARTVRDAAILLGALAGEDAEDAATQDTGRKAGIDYTAFLDVRGLQGARIGVVRGLFGFLDRVDAVMVEALAAIKRAGAELVDPVELTSAAKIGEPEGAVLHYELKADLNAYLARLGPGAPVKSLADVIAFNEKHAKEEMPYFGQDTFLKAEAKGPLTSFEYLEALAKSRRLARTEGIDATMDKHRLDALVAPTLGPACVTDLLNGDRWLGDASTAPAVAGYPHVTVPAGFVFGLPVGLSFFGRAWSEGTLLKLAYAFERATKARKAPKFLPTADLTI